MSDARRLRPVVRPEPDIRQIIQEAQTRWLKPLEVCEILRNYQTYNFKLNPVPPNKPAGGSLFLFDRKALRYFRKDGHNWRKKKDGKTVREAHERLKAGCVDVLHCYYAHGEENPNFQRRSYWMLEGAYEHIVLVHYLEVSQANRFRPSRDLSIDGATRQEALVANSISQPNAAYPSPAASELEVNGPMSSDVTGSTMSSEVEGVDSDGEIYDLEHENEPLVEQGVDNKDISTDWSSLLTSMSYSNQQLPLNVQSSQLLSNREPHQTVSSSELDFADLLKNPDLLGPKPISSAVTLDLSGWNQLLGPTGPNKVVPKEEINYSSWEEILQQCTTPSTSQEILRSIQIKQEEAWSPMNVNDINATASMSPKGLIDALSPRGLGREPQTVLEKYLRDATEENALKAAAEAHRRWTSQQTSQTQQIDIQRPSQKMGTQEMSSQQGWMSFSKQPMQSGNEQLYPSGLNGWNYSLQQPKDQNKLELGYQQMAWQESQIIHTEQQHAKDLNITDQEEILKEFKSNMSFKKVDSFNQWFMTEIGNDEPISRQADSGSLWMTSLEDEGAVEEISSQLQLEMGLNTSISQVQRFTISDFSPDWGFSSSEVKVLVTGKFLNTVRSPSEFSWCCMFGEVEVPAELVNDNVLRCKAPPHAPGRVPFYVTCSNRLACSEVREFEYRLKPETSDIKNLENGTSQSEQELSVQISLTQMLLGNADVSGGRTYSSSISNKELLELKCLVENHRIQPVEMKEKLLQVFLKDKLKNWLMGKNGQAISILNENGQGILHMVAALGYDWAIPLILESGLVVNFRDSHGWTALHWAAAFGREKTILALLAAGAGAGLVTDPTPKYPSGQTPADLASQSGHKGISGFLAEKALTGHLSALTIREGNLNELNTISAAMQGDHAMNAIRNNVVGAACGTEEELALQRSLSAVRNATQAAALIHAAFRQASFREKNLIPEELDLGLLYEEMQAINAANKIQMAYRGHRQKLHLAAVQIQRKFRGWVRRKEFLKLRKHVVRIQAHVRGHQVRKKYRKILWSVGILEKAVLRWRRKRVGLRGFRLDNSDMETSEEVINSDDDDFLKEGRKQKEAAFEKAVTRVHSMARSDVARAQYRRLREDFPVIERQLKSRMGGQDGAL